jgi:Protein of unknown function (DUF1559)
MPNVKAMTGTLIAFFLLNSASMIAQSTANRTSSAVNPQVMAIIPQDGTACLTLRLHQVMQDKALRLVPWEMIQAAGLDTIGLDACKIDRIDFVVGTISEEITSMGIVVTASEKIEVNKLNFSGFEPEFTPEQGKHAYRRMKNSPIAVTFLNDNQAVIGELGTVENLLIAKHGTSPLSQQMLRLGENSHATLIVLPGPIRQLLAKAVPSLPGACQSDANNLIQKINLIAAKAQLSMDLEIPIVIETASEDDAKAVEASWDRLLSYALSSATRTLDSTRRGNGTIDDAMASYQKRVLDEAKKLLKPARNGTRLTLKIDNSALNLVRGASLLPSLSDMISRTGDWKLMSTVAATPNENLNRLAMAFHQYESAFRCFPTAGDTNSQKRKQLSWRVMILPFLGDPELTALFGKFQHEEPWDSPSNIKLLEAIPSIYRHTRAPLPNGQTVYQMPTGPNLAGQIGQAIRFQNIEDGTSNSVAIALSSDQAAVPWTKPEDFNPFDNTELLRIDNGKYTFALFDGSVLELPLKTDIKTLKALLTIAGGEIVER